MTYLGHMSASIAPPLGGCARFLARRSYDLDMSYMGAMGYQMLIEDVLEKNFEHPNVAVGLILIMFYLVETMCPKGVSRPKWAQPRRGTRSTRYTRGRGVARDLLLLSFKGLAH